MPLKTSVKVGNISNLSDARYCSGMGVDLLGFTVIEGHEHYISSDLFREIRGWISGPKIIAEIYGVRSFSEIEAVIENYTPDYLEMNDSEYGIFGPAINLPCIISTEPQHLSGIRLNGKNGYFLLTEAALPAIKSAFLQSALVKINSPLNLLEMLQKYRIAGIAISGSPEIRPGYKDYNALADILELLEE